MKRAWNKVLRAAVRVSGSVFILCLFLSNFTEARELGHYVPGLMNIRDYAVPAEAGFYYLQYNLYYSADDYKDRNGNSVKSVGPVQVDGVQIWGQTLIIIIKLDNLK